MKLSLAMANPNPIGDFLQFIISGCLFGSGGFLLANQVRVRSAMVYSNTKGRYGYGGVSKFISLGITGSFICWHY